MSREKIGKEIGEKLASKLVGAKSEQEIKNLCIEAYKELESLVASGSLKVAVTHARKAILARFPNKEINTKNYYFTISGKGNIERFEHLALYYFSNDSERWEQPRIEHEKSTSLETEKITPQVNTQQITLETMNISQLGLDLETQQMVEKAVNYSGVSLADFVRKALQIHARTVTGKAEQHQSDLTLIPTTELLSSTTYKTHPGRAEELTRRAIYAIETHNNKCTEKSQKWHINQTTIQSLTGSKPATIKTILEKYKTQLDDHNTKHELTPYDNRKTGQKVADDIDLALIVPDGLDING